MTLDPKETRPQTARNADLFKQLPLQVEMAQQKTQFYKELLKGVDPYSVTSLDALAALPVTRKSELVGIQNANPPFGGINAIALSKMKRVFQSPGPIHEFQGWGEDNYRMSRAMRAAGFRSGDLVYNTFSYHFTPGAWIMESGAHALGCCVFPAGTGQTELQAQTIAHLKPRAYTGTPSFLKIILEKSDELGINCSSLEVALVSGEALTPSLRSWFKSRGIQVSSAYAIADLGLIAYESASLLQGMIVDEGVILEIVEPLGTRALGLGEVGEVVITVLDSDYPLIRFATGDLSAIDPASATHPSACGRTNIRIMGWMGRVDQTTKVKGMFLYPGHIQEIAGKNPEVKKLRMVLTGSIGQESMTLRCELAKSESGDLDSLKQRLIQSVRDVTKLRAGVEFIDLNALPQDGLVIEDARSYD
jgi:phenylacetate-CoA ligase